MPRDAVEKTERQVAERAHVEIDHRELLRVLQEELQAHRAQVLNKIAKEQAEKREPRSADLFAQTGAAE